MRCRTTKIIQTSEFFFSKYTYRCTVFSVKLFLKKLARIYAMGGLLRTGWYVINGVYNMYTVLSKVVTGRVYQHVMLALPRVSLCLNCFKPKGEISYTFPWKVYTKDHKPFTTISNVAFFAYFPEILDFFKTWLYPYFHIKL